MSYPPTGVSTNDFAQILADFTRAVSYYVVTKTTDPMTGSEISTFAGAVTVNLVFFKEDQRWMFDTQGLISLADAYILVPLTTVIKRYDKFTIDGEEYYIDSVINRYVTNVDMVYYGRCFKTGGTA